MGNEMTGGEVNSMNNHSEQEANQGQTGAFQSIVESVSRTMNLPASIWVLDEQRQGLKIEAAVGLPRNYVREAFLALGEKSVTGEAYKSGKATTVRDIPSDPRWQYKDQAREMGWKSALCVPIQARGTIIGVISIYAFVTREFSDLEKELLANYAAQIELTIEADRRGATLDRLLEAGHEIERLITEQPKIVLEEIVKAACEVTRADCAVLYPYDPHREDFYDVESVTAYGLSKKLQISERPRKKTGMAAYVRRVGEVIISNIEEEDPDMLSTSPFIKREGVKAFMGIALRVAADVLGILYVDFRTPHPFDDAEKDTIRLFAHQVALAIHNSRSYQQAENRADVLKKLHEVNPTLLSLSGEPEGLRDVLVQIAQNAQSVLGADLVDLYQYVQSRDEYILPVIQVGERYDLSVRKDEIYEDDVVWAIVESRRSQYVAEAQQEPTLTQPYTVVRPDAPPKRFVVREDIESTATVPLLVGTEVVGVLFANYRSPQTFPQQQRELIELFASQAAIAIRNARLSAQTQERLEQLQILSEISKLLMEEHDARETIRLLMQRTLNLFNVDQGSFWSVDYAHNHVNLIFSINQRGEMSDWYQKEAGASVPLEPDSSIVGNTAATREPNLWNDPSGCPYYNPGFAEETGYETKRILSVPLLLQVEVLQETDPIDSLSGAKKVRLERAIGVLQIVNPVDDIDFTEEDQEFLMSIARMAAIALHNAEMHNREMALNEVSQALTTGGRLYEQEILELVYQRAGRLMDVDNMYIALYKPDPNQPDEYNSENPEQSEIHGNVRFGLAFMEGSPIDIQPRKAGKGRTEEIIRTRKPIFHTTKAIAEAWYAQPEHEEYVGTIPSSWLGVPMIAGERLLGVTATYHLAQDNIYSIDDLEILQAMANQAAIALDNAKLYYDVNCRLESLTEIGRLLTADIRRTEEEILGLIHRQASELMDTHNMYIALYESDPNQPDEYNLENPEQSEIHGNVRFGLAFVEGSPIDVQPRKAGKGRTEEIIRTRKPIFISTKAEAEAWYDEKPEREDYLKDERGERREMLPSWLGVPMMVGKRVLGVIATYHPTREYAYSSNDLEILQAMANQAAIALDNAALYRQNSRRVTQLETVQAIANAIETHVELPAFMRSILELSLPRLDAKMGTIQLLDKATNELVVHADVGLVVEREYARIPLDQGVTGQAARERRSIYVPNTSQVENYLPYLGETRSEFAAPLMYGGEIIGVLNIEDPRVDAFDEETRELCELIAAQVAVAIQQKLQLEEEQKRRIEAEKDALLGRFTQAIAHYVKNQVGIVRLAAINLLNDPELCEPPSRRKDLERIKRNAEITLKLAQDMFEPYKQSEKEWVNVNWLIDEAFHLVGEREGVETHLDLATELPQVYIERHGAVQVFQELIINAYKALERGEPPSWLSISSQCSADGDIELLFSNSGPPIPMERWEAIFEQFSGTEDGVFGQEGFGLGLWSARVFLKRQGGEIRVLESNPTQTTFIVRLPVHLAREEG